MDEQAKNQHEWPANAPDLATRRRAFGARLKAAREAKGLSAEALSQLTRINQHYVSALEEGALDRLPGAVFGRGFVRCIAKNMKIDDQALLEEFNSCWTEAPPTSVLKVEIKSKPPKPHAEAMAKFSSTARSLVRRGVVVKVGLPLVAVALGIFAVRHGAVHLPDLSGFMKLGAASVSTPEAPKTPAKELNLAPPERPVPPQATEPEVAKPTAPEPRPEADEARIDEPVEDVVAAQEAAPPPALGQVLELTVTEPVRVRLDVDKGQPVTKELTPDTYRFSFNDKADLLIYDAAALKISFNGKQLGSLGAKGRVRRLSFQAATPETPKNR